MIKYIKKGVQSASNLPSRFNFRKKKLEAEEAAVHSRGSSTKRHLFLHMSLNEQILFIKRLAVMLKAGVPLMRSLRMMHSQVHSRASKAILETLVADVENGSYLSTSMAKFKNIFGDFTVNLVRLGELSGTLQKNMEHLAEELKKKQALRRKVISALVYPVFIVVATLGITVLLTIYVFPKILPLFQSFDFPLPLTTRMLIAVSTFFSHQWLWVLLGLGAAFLSWFLLLKIKRFRKFVHRQFMRVPILGRLFLSYNLANVCRTMGILLQTDVLIVEATKITSRTVTNLAYREQLQVVAEKLKSGTSLSEHFGINKHLFPPIMTQMVAVGESSGELSGSMMFLADMYEEEVDDMSKNLSSMLEPALMVFMGILVGFVALSIITPIYSFTQYIKP